MNIESDQARRWRVPLFIALLAMGVAYIVAFIFLVRHSVDFIAHGRTTAAIAAASARGEVTGELLFKQGSVDLNLLAAGWQPADSEGTWTREGGTLYLPASFAAGAPVEVRFDGNLNESDRDMQVTLEIDGREIGRWKLTHADWQVTGRVLMPKQTTDATTRQLRFRISRPRRPLWLGYSPGLLVYGVRLYYLRVEPLPRSE